ncbi:hypothetical protein PL81_21325, partial [Streptomyces sp. RSD-27]
GLLPFRCTGLRLDRAAPGVLRVRLAPAGQNTLSLALADADGTPVGGIEALALRPADVEELTALGFDHRDSLFRVDWTPLALPAAPAPDRYAVLDGPDGTFAGPGGSAVPGAATPPVVIAGLGLPDQDGADAPARVEEALHRVLRWTREWLAD